MATAVSLGYAAFLADNALAKAEIHLQEHNRVWAESLGLGGKSTDVFDGLRTWNQEAEPHRNELQISRDRRGYSESGLEDCKARLTDGEEATRNEISEKDQEITRNSTTFAEPGKEPSNHAFEVLQPAAQEEFYSPRKLLAAKGLCQTHPIWDLWDVLQLRLCIKCLTFKPGTRLHCSLDSQYRLVIKLSESPCLPERLIPEVNNICSRCSLRDIVHRCKRNAWHKYLNLVLCRARDAADFGIILRNLKDESIEKHVVA